MTGASRGIGAAIARALSGAGAKVVLTARTAADLKRIAGELNGAVAVACDLTDAASLADAVAAARAALGGPPDILVNNAGIFRTGPVDQLEPDTVEETLRINLFVPFRVVHAFLPGMRARGSGHIVTIGSVADRKIFPNNSAYSASKFGLRAMHEVMRTELRGTGVRATLVSPSSVDTPMWDTASGADLPPRDAMLKPEAVADAVVFALTRPMDVNIDELRLARS